MEDLTKFVAFVKGQSAFHWRQVKRYPDDVKRQELHSATANTFEELGQVLLQLAKSLEAEQEPAIKRLGLAWEEIVDLPEELMAELSVSDADKAEFNIISIIDDAGGVASLDRVLVALYRQSGEITKRPALNARIYRMSQKHLLFSVPGKKGAYSTKEISEEEAVDLI